MGSISWVAIKKQKRTHLLNQLNLVEAVGNVQNKRGSFKACELESGWYVILGDLFFDEQLSKENLSQNTEFLSCFASESAMESGIAYYKNEEKVFSVQHSSDEGILHLNVSGDLPQGFNDIRQAMLDKHKDAQEEARLLGQDVDVDYFFSIPAMLSESLCGFRNDFAPTLEGRTFHALKYNDNTTEQAGGTEESKHFPKVPFKNSSFYEDNLTGNTRIHLARETTPTDINETASGPLAIDVDEHMGLDEFLLELIKTDEPCYSNWIAEFEDGGMSAALITDDTHSVLICERDLKIGNLGFENRPIEMRFNRYHVEERKDLELKLCDLINNNPKIYKRDLKTGNAGVELVQMLPHVIKRTHPAYELFNLARMKSYEDEASNPQEQNSPEASQTSKELTPEEIRRHKERHESAMRQLKKFHQPNIFVRFMRAVLSIFKKER